MKYKTIIKFYYNTIIEQVKYMYVCMRIHTHILIIIIRMRNELSKNINEIIN